MPSRRLELVPGDELKAALTDGARAQHEAGDLQASRDSFERAYRLAERAGDAESMALAALGLAGLWVAERRTVTSTVLVTVRRSATHRPARPSADSAIDSASPARSASR